MSTLIVPDGTEFPVMNEPSEDFRLGFLVVIERGQSGWGAYVPDLDGVVAAADSEEEVCSLISEAVAFHLQGLRDDNEAIPEPTSRAHWVTR
jgi:predicted RNase H-like HicB family nuclease